MNIQWTFGRLPHTSSEAELIAFMGAAPGNAEGFLRPNTFSMGGGLGRWLWETYGIPASRHQSHFARNMNAIRGARGQRRGDARTHDPGRPRRRRLEDGSRVLTGKRARARRRLALKKRKKIRLKAQIKKHPTSRRGNRTRRELKAVNRSVSSHFERARGADKHHQRWLRTNQNGRYVRSNHTHQCTAFTARFRPACVFFGGWRPSQTIFPSADAMPHQHGINRDRAWSATTMERSRFVHGSQRGGSQRSLSMNRHLQDVPMVPVGSDPAADQVLRCAACHRDTTGRRGVYTPSGKGNAAPCRPRPELAELFSAGVHLPLYCSCVALIWQPDWQQPDAESEAGDDDDDVVGAADDADDDDAADEEADDFDNEAGDDADSIWASTTKRICFRRRR